MPNVPVSPRRRGISHHLFWCTDLNHAFGGIRRRSGAPPNPKASHRRRPVIRTGCSRKSSNSTGQITRPARCRFRRAAAARGGHRAGVVAARRATAASLFKGARRALAVRELRLVSSLARASLGIIPIGPGILSVLAAMVLAAFTGRPFSRAFCIETHICLVGVDQPLWSRARLACSSGQNPQCLPQPVRRAGARGLHLRAAPRAVVRIVDARPGPDSTRCGTSIWFVPGPYARAGAFD